VVYHNHYPAYYGRGSGLAGALPIVAGGVLGGLVGEQVGYGNHGAIIAGSVAGAVLGHEIAH
jgi:outer membrane lipoprotein SlyB